MVILAALAQQQVSFIEGGSEAGTASLDFVNNVYVVNGDTLTLADIVDLTARRSASGLSVISGTPVEMLGAARDLWLTGQWTTVIEFNATANSLSPNNSRAFLLTVYSALLGNQAALYTQSAASNLFGTYSEDGGGDTRFWQTNTAQPVGTCKIAWTRTDAHSAGDMNGDPVDVDSTDDTAIAIAGWAFPATRVQLADGNNGSLAMGFIRKITLMAPQADGALPGLTS